MSKDLTIEALKAGDQKTYARLYTAYKKDFISFAHKFKIEESDILDIYQDTFLALYDNVARGKIDQLSCSLKTYIFSIGKYKIYENLRANKKLVLEENIEEECEIDHLNLENNQLTERQEKFKIAFEKLGENCQKIINLFYLDKKSIKEIKVLGNYKNENTVKAQKSRCMKTLRELIK